MELLGLRQEYQKQLVKVGVSPNKAKKIAINLSLEELQLIGEIWPDFAIPNMQQNYSHNDVYQKLHPSVFSKTKRIIDIFGAVIGLAMTAVIFLPIAIAIKLNSSGPIFYSQVRCGLKSENFRMWKFRTMIADAEQQKHLVKNEFKGCIFKNKNDWRITSVGKFLRRNSLDEFPQFWNVLRGEMSLVGTRPPTPDEVKNYKSHHHKRLLVKPGITGEWQANGRSNIKNFDDIVQMDLDYQNKWSIVYDLKLILKTIYIIFRRTGAQ